MSATAKKQAPNAEDIRARKGGTPLVSLTAYTTPMARLMDNHCDFVLVGDSVGMVLHGLTSTLGVTMEMMILHGQAVARGLEKAMLVIDMPFASYEESPQQAFRNAARLMVSLFGVSGYGRVCVPINFRLNREEISYIVEHCGAAMLLIDPELADARAKSGASHTPG